MGLIIHHKVERQVRYDDGSRHTTTDTTAWVLKKPFLMIMIVSFNHKPFKGTGFTSFASIVPSWGGACTQQGGAHECLDMFEQ